MITASQPRRRLFNDARVAPPPMLGTMTNSRTVTSGRSTRYSSISRVVSGGLKFHCWRTISRNERPPSGDHRKTNSWVRSVSVSSKTSEIRVSFWGSSKINRMVCVPESAARQPRMSPGTSAASTGYSFCSDVTSTMAAPSRASQPSSRDEASCGIGVIRRLRTMLVYLRSCACGRRVEWVRPLSSQSEFEFRSLTLSKV